MKADTLYHKCGYPVLVVKKLVGPVTQVLFIDGKVPFVEDKDGSKIPKMLKQCPECRGTIVADKLLSTMPEIAKEKGPTGYIPVKM